MKRKRMMRKTVPLITPCDSGLVNKEKRQELNSGSRHQIAIHTFDEKINHLHLFLYDFIQVHAIKSGRYEMILKSRNKFDCCNAPKCRHTTVDDKRKSRDWRHLLRGLTRHKNTIYCIYCTIYQLYVDKSSWKQRSIPVSNIQNFYVAYPQ